MQTTSAGLESMERQRQQIASYMAEMISSNYDLGSHVKEIRRAIERTESYTLAVTLLAYLVTGIVAISALCYACAKQSHARQEKAKRQRLNACSRILEA
ncbi:hypothetical protein T10_1745 [Trichinella papuae]|uniref:Uncharacterized protein n=1 Tax=Trichinella papuae TaxID=268474 RepID=A0A0V1MDR1_9BILA|nr:hypothetical protein T10_1745 [Trichinella papuae]